MFLLVLNNKIWKDEKKDYEREVGCDVGGCNNRRATSSKIKAPPAVMYSTQVNLARLSGKTDNSR